LTAVSLELKKKKHYPAITND